MSFDYEKSIWGSGTASTKITDPTAFRLRTCLKAIASLPAGSKVVEVGCGAGQFIRAVKKYHSELTCVGTDISESALKIARSANDNVEYILQTETKLPFDSSTVDAVLVFDVLEHVESPENFLLELKRVLKPGGEIYAFVPCEGDNLSMWHWLREMNIGGDLTKKHAGHIQYFSRDGLKQMIVERGLRVYISSYSEHIIGQLLGVVAFFLMDQAAKKRGDQINNEAFFNSKKSNKIVKILKDIVNTIVFFESSLLQWLPSPNIHLVIQKPAS